MYDERFEIIGKKVIPVFVLVETSERISEEIVCSGLERLLVSMLIGQESNDDVIEMAVLEFNDSCKWMTSDGLTNINEVTIDNVVKGRNCDMIGAFYELNKMMRLGKFMIDRGRYHMPIIILITDRHSLEEWNLALENVSCNNWFRYSTRLLINPNGKVNADEFRLFTGYSIEELSKKGFTGDFDDMNTYDIERIIEWLCVRMLMDEDKPLY